MFLSHKLWERKFCVLRCTSGWDRLLLALHSQLLKRLHRSREPVVYQVMVDVRPVGNNGRELRLFP